MNLCDNDNDIKNNNAINDCFPFAYKLYFHDPYLDDWSENSYCFLHYIKTIHDYWIINDIIKDKLNKGMFFIMKENIFPIWDNEDNKNGGTFSFKILKNNAGEMWNIICGYVLMDKLYKFGENNNIRVINGLSISPKKDYCIVKIWLSGNGIKI